MRAVVFAVLAVVVAACAPAATTPEYEIDQEGEIVRAVEVPPPYETRTDQDEFTGITGDFLEASPPIRTASGQTIYLGAARIIEEGEEYLALRVWFYADDWLFIDRALALADGEALELEIDTDRNVGSGGRIQEFVAAIVSRDEYAQIANAEEARLSLRGDGRVDFVIPKGVQSNLARFFNEYVAAAEEEE